MWPSFFSGEYTIFKPKLLSQIKGFVLLGQKLTIDNPVIESTSSQSTSYILNVYSLRTKLTSWLSTSLPLNPCFSSSSFVVTEWTLWNQFNNLSRTGREWNINCGDWHGKNEFYNWEEHGFGKSDRRERLWSFDRTSKSKSSGRLRYTGKTTGSLSGSGR